MPLASGTPPAVQGTIYGPLLNEQSTWDRYAERMRQPPYGAPPTVPVLFIKPRNTLAGDGATVHLPAYAGRVEVGASIGLVFARPAARVATDAAMATVEGFTIVLDLGVPNDNLYRPPILEKCFDGSCPVGPRVVPRASLDLSAVVIRSYVNDELRQERGLDDLIRPAPQLVADVSDFMTLRRGDVLTLGYPVGAVPTAGRGDRIRIAVDGIGILACTISQESAP